MGGIFKIFTNNTFIYSVVSTAISFFVIGIVKGKIVAQSVLKLWLHTLTNGGIASVISYTIGYILGIYWINFL